MSHKLSYALSAFLATTALAFSISASALQPPKGKVILTISGKVAEKNTPTGADFDLEMLEKLPQSTFTTVTPWSRLPIKFTGPLLRDVFSAAKATGSLIRATALNDYKSEIPFGDVQKFDVILAHKMDGENIPIKTKGPLFIVYPYDTKDVLRSNVYYERSPWQLRSLTTE